MTVVTKLLVVAVQMLYLGFILSQAVTKLDGKIYGKIQNVLVENFMNVDDNTLKALISVKNVCFDLMCCLLLKLSIICIYCKFLKSVTVNCWKNITIYVKAIRTRDRNSFTIHCNERESKVNCKFSESQPKASL